MSKIRTFSGQRFDLLDPDPSDVRLVDVAHGLALTCRFASQAKTFYSVAEHCVRMSLQVPPRLAVDALLHDCAEAYLGDVPSPLKHTPEMAAFRQAERFVEAAVRTALGMRDALHSPEIGWYDKAMYLAEARDLMNEPVGLGALTEERIVPWPWEVARQKFLDRFEELVG